MTEKLKRIISLLCLIAMLSVVSVPASAGGEHPLDSDSDTGEDDGGNSDSGSGDDPSEQGVTGVVYIGPGGIFSFIGQTVYSFIVRISDPDKFNNDKRFNGESRNETQG